MAKQGKKEKSPENLPFPVKWLQMATNDPEGLHMIEALEYWRRRFLSQGEKWEAWCFLPMTLAWYVLSGFQKDFSVYIDDDKNYSASLQAYTLSTWRQTKGIYRFDPTVLEYAAGTKLKGIPSELLLKLPEWCIYVETPGEVLGKFAGFFAMLSDTENLFSAGRRYLILHFINPPNVRFANIELSTSTIEESVWTGLKNGGDPQEWINLIGQALGILTYLCSDPEIVHSSGNSKKKPHNLRPGDIPKDQKKTATWNIWRTGFKKGREIREYEKKAWQGGTKRPHVRAAHLHHYWIGPRDGARNLISKWLPTIMVNTNKAEDIQPTIREIKDNDKEDQEQDRGAFGGSKQRLTERNSSPSASSSISYPKKSLL